MDGPALVERYEVTIHSRTFILFTKNYEEYSSKGCKNWAHDPLRSAISSFHLLFITFQGPYRV